MSETSIIFIIVCGIFGGLALWSLVAARHFAKRHPATGRFVGLGDQRLHCLERSGPKDHKKAAPTFVLIHGASGNARDMDEALGEKLANFGNVLSFDRPGQGWSARKSERAAGAPDHQAKILAQALIALNLERALVVGHSFGAAVALALARAMPNQVEGLILLAPASHPWPGGGISWHNQVAAKPIIGPIFARIFPALLGPLVIPSILPYVFKPDGVPSNYAERTGLTLLLRPKSFRANAIDMVDLLSHLRRLSPSYRELKVPTLIIAGAKDTIVRNDLHAEALAREISGARLVVLPGVGHMPGWSAGEEVTRLITQFMHTQTMDLAMKA